MSYKPHCSVHPTPNTHPEVGAGDSAISKHRDNNQQVLSNVLTLQMHYLTESSKPSEADIIVILQLRRLKLRMGTPLTQDHTARKLGS